MLAAEHRLRSSEEFRQTWQGVRAGRPAVVVVGRRSEMADQHSGDKSAPRVGFVVSKAVGGAVTRNRVKRRLRHIVQPWLTDPELAGLTVVVRALPPAASVSDLADQVRSAWQHMLTGVNQRARRSGAHPAPARPTSAEKDQP